MHLQILRLILKIYKLPGGSSCNICITKKQGLLEEALKDKENFRKIVYPDYTDEMVQLSFI